ncbi:hypothetical protein J4G02_05100 [Candidatus Poribacteria bacterium]|nr:hypothetical protein [Candidatus Poribacteria bacterium]
MTELRYTLVTDGSSDIALIPILTWLLRENGVAYAIQSAWADLNRIPHQKRRRLEDKIHWGLELYPCDLLFVHRDAEREPRENRVSEITTAIQSVVISVPPRICVVPVRMQEAWLLFDEPAINHAAGNSSNRQSLYLPAISRLEDLPDPKTVLHERLKQASNLKGRRLSGFPVSEYARRVTEFIQDFSPLRALSAFAALESELQQIIKQQGWDT